MALTDPELMEFLGWALPRIALRREGLRRVRSQVRKRLIRRLRALGLGSLDAYREHLQHHSDEWAVLDRCCWITASRFYRDARLWDALTHEALPALARLAAQRGDPAVRAWSAGCASGEEPYTLRLAWELGPAGAAADRPLRILASDADHRMLRRAQRACYAAPTLKELPEPWRAQAFAVPTFEQRPAAACTPADAGPAAEHHQQPRSPAAPEYRLRDRFRTVDFLCHDVRSEPPRGPFHLVLCRNLIATYYTLEQQREVLARIAANLVPGGVLVLGRKERLPPGLPELVSAGEVYRRR